MTLIITALLVITLLVYCKIAHLISYHWLKNKIVKRKKWDLNICCGQTDGGGINVDIVEQKNIPNLKIVRDIYKLPFKNNQFQSVLCSHTIEHVDDPQAFFKELQRVGQKVTLVIPPLYDITAALNIFEHKHLFLSFKKEHHQLPHFIKLPFASSLHKRLGQINNAASNSRSLVLELILSIFSANRRKHLKVNIQQSTKGNTLKDERVQN